MPPQVVKPLKNIKTIHPLLSNQQAYDIIHASTSYRVISQTKVIVPEKVKNFNLQVNETKTEENEVTDKENLGENGSWTKRKQLCIFLDSNEDIQLCKTLTISHMTDKNTHLQM